MRHSIQSLSRCSLRDQIIGFRSEQRVGSRSGPLLLVLLACVGLSSLSVCHAIEPIEVGSRLQLMVDDHLVDKLSGKADLQLHRPIPRQVAIVHDEPWEGNNCAYHTVIQDDGIYRMYYRGTCFDLTGDKLRHTHDAVVCYAESKDGVDWTKPKLGLFDFDGSKENNIVWKGKGSHNFAPVKDANPDCSPQAKYKALGGLPGEGGLFAFKSSDGIRWSLLDEKPVITKGAFDSQNLAFWDTTRHEYRVYFRVFREGRDINTATSADFLNWTEPVLLEYTDGRKTQLYTNQVTPYYRAPHVFLGFPTRYVDGRGLLTPLNEKLARSHPRYGNDYTDGGFMSSRDGTTFHVWGEAFLRPGPVKQGRWLYGGNYQNWGIVETEMEPAPEGIAGLLGPGSTKELSIYSSEGGWLGTANRMRRYTLRIDGFVSVNAPMSGGEVVTKPLRFDGRHLEINYATSAAGSIRVELQTDQGEPIPGFALADSCEIFGDQIQRTVSWKEGDDVSRLAAKPIRLRLVMKDADLYSFRFSD
jgi:hypothetical protein